MLAARTHDYKQPLVLQDINKIPQNRSLHHPWSTVPAPEPTT
jgi:hypothetical protein